MDAKDEDIEFHIFFLYSFYIMDLLSGYKMLIKPSKDSQDPSISNGVVPTKKISAKYYF